MRQHKGLVIVIVVLAIILVTGILLITLNQDESSDKSSNDSGYKQYTEEVAGSKVATVSPSVTAKVTEKPEVTVEPIGEAGDLEDIGDISDILTPPPATAAPTVEIVVPTTQVDEPTSFPDEEPYSEPGEEPTSEPIEVTTPMPTELPTATPTEVPTDAPTKKPTAAPTEVPPEISVPTPNPKTGKYPVKSIFNKKHGQEIAVEWGGPDNTGIIYLEDLMSPTKEESLEIFYTMLTKRYGEGVDASKIKIEEILPPLPNNIVYIDMVYEVDGVEYWIWLNIKRTLLGVYYEPEDMMD